MQSPSTSKWMLSKMVYGNNYVVNDLGKSSSRSFRIKRTDPFYIALALIKLMALMDYDAGMFSEGSVRGPLSGTMIKMIDMMDYDAGRVKTRR